MSVENIRSRDQPSDFFRSQQWDSTAQRKPEMHRAARLAAFSTESTDAAATAGF